MAEAVAALSPWGLYRQAIRDYRKHLGLIAGIVTVVALPVAILANFAGTGSNQTFTAYISFAQVTMNTALIYAIVKIFHAEPSSIRRSYYDGAGGLVRFFLLAVLLVLMLLPFIWGIYVFSSGSAGPSLSAGELSLLAGLGILLSIPSVLLIARSVWAIYVVFETRQGPIEALRTSWRLTAGRMRQAVGRLLALGVLLFLTMLVPVLVLGILDRLTGWHIFGTLLQYSLSLIVQPLANLYLYRYYRGLHS